MNQGPLILEPLLFAVFKLLIEAMCVLYVYLSGLIWVSDVIEMRVMKCRCTCEMEAHIHVQMDFQL